MANRLLKVIEQHLHDDPASQARALLVFQHARELVSQEPCDARLVFATVLVLEMEAETPDQQAQAEQLLIYVGFDREAIERVHRLVDGFRNEKPLDSLEYRVACDARYLARMATANPDTTREQLEEVIRNELKTEAAKQRAQSLFPN